MEGDSKQHILYLHEDIPSELLEVILINLAREDLPSLFITRLVCKSWNNILKNSVPLPPARRANFLQPRRPTAMRVMAAVARRGNLNLLKWLREQGSPWDEKVCRVAAKEGHLEILVWLKEMGCPTVTPRMMGHLAMAKWRANFLTTHPPTTSDDNNSDSKRVNWVAEFISSEEELFTSAKADFEEWLGGSSKVAAANGHFNILQWGFESKAFHFGKAAVAAAAGAGHLDIVKWLVDGEPACEWNGKALQLAAKGGHLDVMKWLLEKHIDPSSLLGDPEIMNEAAGGGHLEVMKWLRERMGTSVPLTPEMCRRAAHQGRLDMLEWLKAEGCQLVGDSWLMSSAAAGGHVATLKWLREQNGVPFDTHSIPGAIKHGHWEVLKWLKERGSPWGTFSYYFAVKAGCDWEMLRWLKENGCPWNLSVEAAAEKGRLDVVKWMHENGCPLTQDSCDHAAYGGQLEVLKWLRANGCAWDETNVLAVAASHGDREMAEWARENGCAWHLAVSRTTAQEGQLEMLKWLREQGCPWDSSTLKAAIVQGHFEVFLWAFENGCPLDP